MYENELHSLGDTFLEIHELPNQIENRGRAFVRLGDGVRYRKLPDTQAPWV